MVTSSLVPSVLFTSSVSTQQLKAIRAFFCARKLQLQPTPRTQNHQLYLTADRSATYSRPSLISYSALYNSELRLIMATDAILVLALLI